MNSFILMAEIITEPELRYTADNQKQIAEMLVQFPGWRDEDPPAKLKVIGWNKLAQEIHQQYHKGDRVVIEGSLSMNVITRPDNLKEKRAELTASRIYPLASSNNNGSLVTAAPAFTTTTNNVVPLGARRAGASTSEQAYSPMSTEEETPQYPYNTTPPSAPTPTHVEGQQNLDDIPF